MKIVGALSSSALFAAVILIAVSNCVAAPVVVRGTRYQNVEQSSSHARIFILMIWDGMRPDFVSSRETPNLFALERQGVRLERHHSQYPTLTLVNAATLATGTPPAVAGIFGDTMYLAPELKSLGINLPAADLMRFAVGPVSLEDTHRLTDLNAPDALKGTLLGIDSVVQEVAREGGYIAVLGKHGPTFMFNDRVFTIKNGVDELHEPNANYLFATDDAAAPPSAAPDLLAALPPATHTGVADGERDRYFAQVVADRAIPAAKRATDAGHPALIVLWSHNPDLTQHIAGLGTLPALEAVTLADDDLGVVRAAVASNGVADRTDIMVVSDHGFATIRLRVSLSALLVSSGLKKAKDSTDVVVAPNGGSDLVYLSRDDFKTRDAVRDRLQKIVDFAEAQEWCGPIFSREISSDPITRRGRYAGRQGFLGWIDGTFAQGPLGLFNSGRSPDLIISFAEVSNISNKGFTGPEAPAFALEASGQQAVPNRSQPLIHPVMGLVYADLNSDLWTTGMGMHGAAGMREIHNVGAAIGPDFRRGFTDTNPTSNVDVAPTIERVLELLPNVGPGGVYPAGRVMTEILEGGRSYVGSAHSFTATSELELQGVEAITRLKMTRLGDHLYLDDSSVDRKPLGSSP